MSKNDEVVCNLLTDEVEKMVGKETIKNVVYHSETDILTFQLCDKEKCMFVNVVEPSALLAAFKELNYTRDFEMTIKPIFRVQETNE